MSTHSRLLYLIVGALLASIDLAAAQELPPSDLLREIAAKLPHHPKSNGTTFQPSGTPAADPLCRMQPFTMTLASGSRSSRSLPVLLDRKPADAKDPVMLLTVLHRVAVDADGSPRAYHPEDPRGRGTCRIDQDADGIVHYTGACALDELANAEILVFRGAQRLSGDEFASEWHGFWPLIHDKKLKPFDMKKYVTTAPDGYYFLYWKDRNLSAFFKSDIIPRANDGYPCLSHDGYFVAATTLKQDNVDPANSCAPSRYMDAEKVPFLVLPDDTFGNAHAGDIVVARLEGAPADRLVYGVVGDTGPVAQFGEASIAFNRALLGKSKAVMNEHDADTLDISGKRVSVMVFGGTKALLNGDYSAGNIKQVGRTLFARWNNDPSSPAGRLDACVRQFDGN